MRQTVIDYGDQRLWNVQTNSVNQEQVFDSSGTDVIYSRITVNVTGYIREWDYLHLLAVENGVRSSEVEYDAGNPELAPTDNGAADSLVDNVNRWRNVISQRVPFRMWIGCDAAGANGTRFLWVRPYADAADAGIFDDYNGGEVWMDADAGPKCRQFNVEKVLAAHAVRVTAVFELCVPWCETFSTANAKILLNRWSVADSIDENLFTTRTYNGILKAANPYINPNLLRHVVLPPLANGMRRKSMKFDVGDDGRTLKYSITDEEAAFAAPRPATSWNVVQSDSIGLEKPLVHTSLSIELMGNRDANKKDLMALAVAIAQEKISGLVIQNAGNAPVILIDELTMVDYISSSGPVRVDLRLSCRRTRDDGDAFNGAAGNFGAILTGDDFPYHQVPFTSYDSSLTDDPGDAGPVPFTGAVISYLRTVCYGPTGSAVKQAYVSDPDDANDPIDDPAGMPDVTARTVPAGTMEAPEWVSTQFKDALYTDYQVDTIWDTVDSRIQLPIAQSAAGYSSGADTCAVVRLGRPLCRRIIRIAATRLGEAPVLQEPVDTWTIGSTGSEITFTRLSRKIAPTVPEKAADGQDVWTVRAEYVYACSRHPLNDEEIPIGIDPSFTGMARLIPTTSLSTFTEQSDIT